MEGVGIETEIVSYSEGAECNTIILLKGTQCNGQNNDDFFT